jgi:hypothetical protein
MINHIRVDQIHLFDTSISCLLGLNRQREEKYYLVVVCVNTSVNIIFFNASIMFSTHNGVLRVIYFVVV